MTRALPVKHILLITSKLPPPHFYSYPKHSVALKNNLLYDALLVPNLGIEIALGHGWSVGAMGVFAWWDNSDRRRFERIYGGELEVRRYFGAKSGRPLSGQHIGLYAQALTYDLKYSAVGYKSDLSYGAGVSYGYSLPISSCLSFDFTVGIGYFGGKYESYTSTDTHYVWKETKRRNWWGPTKAEVSLVWLIGGGHSKKGGRHE